MQVTLSYTEQGKRVQTQIPYYELQNVAQEIYEKEKSHLDWKQFEQKYTYFKPYLDYILLYKEGRIDSFLMDFKRSIYSIDHHLYYFSKTETRIHEKTDIVPYLKADDETVMLNQDNLEYDCILLPDGNHLSYQNGKIHDLLIHFYLHSVLSQNKEIAVHYASFIQYDKPNWIHSFHDHETAFSSFYLNVIRYVDFQDYLWYIGAKEIETPAQTEWLHKHQAKPIHMYRLNEEQIETAKQFMKSFF